MKRLSIPQLKHRRNQARARLAELESEYQTLQRGSLSARLQADSIYLQKHNIRELNVQLRNAMRGNQ